MKHYLNIQNLILNQNIFLLHVLQISWLKCFQARSQDEKSTEREIAEVRSTEAPGVVTPSLSGGLWASPEMFLGKDAISKYLSPIFSMKKIVSVSSCYLSILSTNRFWQNRKRERVILTSVCVRFCDRAPQARFFSQRVWGSEENYNAWS